MKSRFIFLLIIVLGITTTPTFSSSSVPASETVAAKQADDFHGDLLFVRKTLLENHPGVCDTRNPDFVEEMERNFTIAEQKLAHAGSNEEKADALKEFGRSFRDGHLWIRYNFNTVEAPLSTNVVRSFDIQELKEGIVWITIPTFAPSQDQIKILKKVIELLPQFREKAVVCDLRGNGGGSSAWGEDLLKALFGEDYVSQQLAESSRNVYAEWRISPGNLELVKDAVLTIKEQFGENHSTTQYIENIYKKMENASLLGENYYREDPDQSVVSSNAVSLFKGRIVAIIDRHCASSALTFIDNLKAMNSGVTFVGETTSYDTAYTELREAALLSGKGILGFPIKVWRNRARNNVPYVPDIHYQGNLTDTQQLQDFLIKNVL